MGFNIYYRSASPVDAERARAIAQSADELCQGRTWLHCEPVHFFPREADGHLFGGSKPNFTPHPDDARSAELEGLPDGTVHDLLDVLARLSRDHEVDWEISHDESGGPAGAINGGTCADVVIGAVEAFAGLAEALENLVEFDEEGFPRLMDE